MNQAKHYQLGKLGERLAIGHLLSKGYVILEQNWRLNNLEVDIIADDGECIVFIEVKTRSTDIYGDPADAVDREKRLHLINAADAYVSRLHLDVQVRFDIIAIIANDNETKIQHYEDAFFPGDDWIDELPGN